jgi:cell division cycle protein 37
MIFDKNRMRIPNHKSRDFMMDDVNKTYNRIVARVKEIKAKELSDAEIDRAAALEYLNSHLQPDGTYALPLTEESSLEEIERAKVFAEFPVVLQKGLLLQDPDAINDGLKGLDQDTINLYLKKATDVGLISLEEEEDAEEEVEETKENQTQASDADGKMKKATPDESIGGDID